MTEKQIEDQIELVVREMKALGYWSEAPAPELDHQKLYSQASFENWLQFVYLKELAAALAAKSIAALPPYRVGLAAFRNYDYMSPVPEAERLLDLLQGLEKLVVQWALEADVSGEKEAKDWYRSLRKG